MKRLLSIAAFKTLASADEADVSFVPPLVRRRLSPLQKVFFALAKAVAAPEGGALVFASRDGEDTLTRRIVEDFHADGSVSPHRFSTSVYNAAPGLWSVFARDRSAYTAVAAGDDTVECGLLEALGSVTPATFVYAEETGGGYGAAIRFAGPDDGVRLAVSPARPGGQAIGFADFANFLAGASNELNGRWIHLERRG